MPTGAQIREFIKKYREVQYTEQGSLILSETEHNAYLNRLTIEITHVDAPRSVNYKTLPDNTHWGYLTTFKGSSVINSLAVKFVKQRVFEHINQGIWHYHQATENTRVNRATVQTASNAIVEAAIPPGQVIRIIRILIAAKQIIIDPFIDGLDWIFEYDFGEDEPEENTDTNYTGFPVASPFPDIFKFKADVPVSFKFRLESWYLVEPGIYEISNPTDTSDETEDEDQYPEPTPGDGDGGGQEFPAASAPPSGADPRDFAEDVDQPGTGVWTFTLSFSDPGSNPACNNVPASFASLRGFPDEPPQREFTGPPGQYGGRPGRFFTSVDSFNHSGDCGIGGPGNPVFTPDGPSNQ